jgi:HEAT repeat protein
VLRAPDLRRNIQLAFQLEKGIRAGGEDAVTRLLEFLKGEENPIVRSWIVRLLGDVGGKTPMPELARLVRDDPSEEVRACAANALALIGDESVLDVLNEAALKDCSRTVNEAARKAIEAIVERR